MLHTKIILSETYQKRLELIENFIWESSNHSFLALDNFLTEHDRVLEFLKENPSTPAPHPLTGDQSWPFGDGRYRLFFKLSDKCIELLDLIDNRMSNQKVYPNNSLPTYNED